jgi:hypothetical protein
LSESDGKEKKTWIEALAELGRKVLERAKGGRAREA